MSAPDLVKAAARLLRPFCCGGSLEVKQPICVFLKKDGIWNGVYESMPSCKTTEGEHASPQINPQVSEAHDDGQSQHAAQALDVHADVGDQDRGAAHPINVHVDVGDVHVDVGDQDQGAVHAVDVHVDVGRQGQGAAHTIAGHQGKPTLITLEELQQACSPASFGKGTLDVVDASYRNSLKLDRSEFTVNIDVGELGILVDIQKLLQPNAASIRPELYKLNMYDVGSFFGPHVDTPRGHDMFGSLVIGLPTFHEGGHLLVGHPLHDRKHEYAWGSKTATLNWAAFYSDCQHEVTRVTDGMRITLTYNLYAYKPTMDLLPLVDMDTMELCQLFLKAKQEISSGNIRVLGFPCKYTYPFLVQKIETENARVSMLKGEDSALYAAAKYARLPVKICRVWDVETSSFDLRSEERVVDKNLDGFKMSDGAYYEDDGDYDIRCFMTDRRRKVTFSMRKKDDYSSIEWCREADFKWTLGGAHGYYGNEAAATGTYSAAAILVYIGSKDDSDS